MDIPELKRNSNNFSFHDTAADVATNNDFREGYIELLNGEHTAKSYIWEVLSGVGNEIGEVLYENVLNYVDNVANINTCKLRPLKSIAQILGISDFELLGNLRELPSDVENAIDIFSIRPEYLVGREFASNDLVKAIQKNCFDYFEMIRNRSDLSDEVLSSDKFLIEPRLDVERYRTFVENAFFGVLSSHIFSKYGDDTYIFSNFTKNELLEGETIDSMILSSDKAFTYLDGSGKRSNNDTYERKISAIKSAYGISPSFDEQKILDNIEFGSDSLENYQGGELSVLQIMLELRDRSKFDRIDSEKFVENEMEAKLTRFAYYKEKDFFDYYKFIQTFYAKLELNKYGINHTKRYELDKNYTEFNYDGFSLGGTNNVYDEFSIIANQQLYKEIDSYLSEKSQDLPTLSSVAKDLTDISFAICEIREQLKLQGEKNYMRGTKLLLEYVVAEYLKNSLSHKYPSLSAFLNGDVISVDKETGEKLYGPKLQTLAIEYDDGTEYFNISSHNTISAYNRNSVNPKYWYDLDGIDVSLNGDPLEKSEISSFYNENMNLRLGEDLKDFLCAVYEIGNDASYFTKDEDGTLHMQLDKESLSSSYLSAGTLLSGDLDEILSAEQELFLMYHGSKVGYNPWFNYKNITHSSFQAHPFMYKFVEHVQKYFSIENAFQGEAPVYLMKKLSSPEISTYLDKMGTLSNLWQVEGSIYDYSGWQSRYEYEEHTAKKANGKRSPVTDYDGTFYPPAVDEFSETISSDYLAAKNRIIEERQKIAEEGEEIVEPTPDEIEIENTHSGYQAILSSIVARKSLDDDGNETFYGKWYSHLNLTEDNAAFIARQLSVFTEDILEIVTPKDDYSKIYDIYKYGLDKYNNSFTLYKQYAHGKNATEKERQNTLGSLWFRLNNHPIGFPAFAYELGDSLMENIQNDRYVCSPIILFDKPHVFDAAEYFEDEDELKKEKASIKKANTALEKRLQNMGRKGKVFLDIEFTPNTEYIILVAPKDIQTWNEEEQTGNVVVFPNRVYELESLQFTKEKKLITEEGFEYTQPIRRSVYAFLNYDYLRNNWTAVELTGKFKGFAKNKSTLYCMSLNAAKKDDEVTGLQIDLFEFPPPTAALYGSKKQKTINFNSLQNKENNSLSSMQVGMWTKLKAEDEDNIKLAFNADIFYLMFPTSLEESDGLPIRTFVGAHSLSSETQTENDDYGKNTYDQGTVLQESLEHNSFDRFTDFITVLDIPREYFNTFNSGSVATFKNYALNSDSSWIPSYPGTDGYSQTWKVGQYRSSIHQSAELLGHSYNKLPKLIIEKKRFLGIDDEGNQTVNSLDSLLSTSLRVYEDFELSDYLDYRINDPLQDIETDGTDEYYEWSYDLLSSVNEDNIGDYQIMMFNLKSGSYDSIINCYLSDLLVDDFSDEKITYSPVDSVYESGLLDGKPPTERLRIVGTPNPFGSPDDLDSETLTNHIINIKNIKVKCVKNENGIYTLTIRFYRNRTHGTRIDGTETDYSNFYIHRKTLGTFIFKESLSEYEKYHYMEPFTLWPYAATMISGENESNYGSRPWPSLEDQHENKRLWNYPFEQNKFDPNYDIAKYDGVNLYNTISSSYPTSDSKLDAIDLTQYTSLSSIYELKNGHIMWKISEEDSYNFLRDLYPPKLIDQMIYSLFDMNNVNKSMDNIFALSNTYIFQLEDPEEMSELISEVAVPLYTITDTCLIAWEDYLSDSYYVDQEGVEMVHYVEHFDPSTIANVCSITSDSDIPHPEDLFHDDAIYAVSSWMDDVDFTQYKYQENLWDRFAKDDIQVFPTACDVVDEKSMTDVRYFTVSPKQLEDYLKLYVSYSMYESPGEEGEHNEEIELHFNTQNLFMPMFKVSQTGKSYHTTVKPSTFLSLKSHETGFLQIVIQLQLIDGSGNIAGIRDLPLLTYKIMNLSDDKPKFTVSRIWRIDNRDGNQNTLSGLTNAFLIVDTVKYDIHDISSFIGTNFNIEEDFPATTRMYMFSDMPIAELSGTFYYETGKGYSASQDDATFVHEDEWSRPGTFKTDDGFVDFEISGSCAETKLEFTLKEGMLIPETEPNLYFPIDVLSARAIDTKGNIPKIIILNGGIEFDFSGTENMIITGRYLAREANPNKIKTQDHPEGNTPIRLGDALNSAKFGWILEETENQLIRVFNKKHEGTDIESDTDDITLLIPDENDGGKYKELVSTASGGTRTTQRKNPTILLNINEEDSGIPDNNP